MADQLTANGWTVTPFGRITFTGEFNTRLDQKRKIERLRFLPDFVGLHDARTALIDVKSATPRNRDSPNYAIADVSLDVLHVVATVLNVDGLVIWPDGLVSTTRWLTGPGQAVRTALPPVRDRVTPFYLYPKAEVPAVPISRLTE